MPMPSPPWPAPRLVAEDLRVVAEPAALQLRSGRSAAPAAIARFLARQLAPTPSAEGWPDWLREEQRLLADRCARALAAHRGALLAEPVGSGKTWIALAVAARMGGGPAAVLCPAALEDHWRRVAHELSVPVRVRSHAAASRGRLPDAPGLVIVDESHHYRHPETRRYAAVSHWLLGRPALLLSATPAVNGLEDVAAQLLLAVRDDALSALGVPSLRAACAGGEAPAALGELVLARPRPAVPSPRPAVSPDADAARVAEGIAALRCADEPGVAALVRRVLLGAAASSPAALADALRRYEQLLAQAGDAEAAGRRTGRHALRAFVGADASQTVLWALLPDADEPALALDDRSAVTALRRMAESLAGADDARCAALRSRLADGVPTLVFCTRRATVRWLRDRLADLRPWWCTGDRAGLGPTPLPRRHVLARFAARGEAAVPGTPASLLITTDLAAEGLDLRRLGRVIHYDLPWTAARLEQRAGRIARPGADCPAEILPLAAELERPLRLAERVAQRATLAARLGLEGDTAWRWTWREALAVRLGPGQALAGEAVVDARHAGVLAGLRVADGAGAVRHALVWADARGHTDQPGEVVPRLHRLARRAGRAPTDAERSAVHALLAPVLRERLGAAWRASLDGATAPAGGPRLRARLDERIRRAARLRDLAAIRRLEAWVAWVAGGHTAGELALLRTLAGADDDTLARRLASPPPGPPRAAGWPRVEVAAWLLAVATGAGDDYICPPCRPDSARCSSTSTAP